ncbi:MAG: RluA family pseudouridine synthase [Clostridia bacterium]
MKFNFEFNQDPKRLDVFLAECMPEHTRSAIKNAIDYKHVLINNVHAKKAGAMLKKDDRIEIEFVSQISSCTAENIPIEIVFECDDFAIVNKPQGMVVHPAVGNPNKTLVNALLYKLDTLSSGGSNLRPGIVHRLDKNTSGLLVVAKNDFAHAKLAKQIAEKTCKRYYLAIVCGNIENDCGQIETYIARSPKDRKKMAVSNQGKLAKTSYKVLERFGRFSFVEFQLQTGRTHQIRVHASFIHHPVACDEVYGTKNKEFVSLGQLLHAYKLELSHPRTGEVMSFKVGLPEYFAKALKHLDSKKLKDYM